MPTREYRCAVCQGDFAHECRGRPRVCCPDCAPIRARRQIAEWSKNQTPAQRRVAYGRNRESIIRRAAAWNKTHRERRVEIVRAYDSQPHVRAIKNKRNRRRAVREYADILLADPCSYCGGPAQQLDHITPLSREGSDTTDNLTAVCGGCNRSKHAKSLLIFMLTATE